MDSEIIPVSTSRHSEGAPPSLWLYFNARLQGPFGANALKALMEEGGATNQTLAWTDGMAAWAPLGDNLPHMLKPQVLQLPKGTMVSAFPAEPEEPTPVPTTPKQNASKKGWASAVALTSVVLATLKIHQECPELSLGSLAEIFGIGCALVGIVVWCEFRKAKPSATAVDDAGNRLPDGSDQPPSSIFDEAFSMVEDSINWCLFHISCALMAVAMSWLGWMVLNAWLSTSVTLLGAGISDPNVGAIRAMIHEKTGFEDPWFCCLILGVIVTAAIGFMRVPAGIYHAVVGGNTRVIIKLVHDTKVIAMGAHVFGFGLSAGVAIVENTFGAGIGGAAMIAGLVGWPYLKFGATAYATPVRYVINLVYGAAIFAFVFPLELHGFIGSGENIQNGEWLWLIWTLFLAIAGLVLLCHYCRGAWYQGYGLGLWIGSWVPPRGWGLRRIYRTPACLCFHTDPETL